MNYRSNGRDDVPAAVAALAGLRDEGLLDHIGLSNVGVDALAAARGVTRRSCACRTATHRATSAPTRATCSPCVARPASRSSRSSPSRGSPARTPPAEQYDAVREIADAHDATPAQVRIAWNLALGPHVLAIPGTGDLGHLEQNVAAAALRLTEDRPGRARGSRDPVTNRTPPPFRRPRRSKFPSVLTGQAAHEAAVARLHGVLRRDPGGPGRAPGQEDLQPLPPPRVDRRTRARRLRPGRRHLDRRAAQTADVQGMCTYEDLVDATLPRGFIPYVVPAAPHDHARRSGQRPGHRVDQLPQRPAARVRGRDGHLHRIRRGRHDRARRRPVRHVPELLRLPRLRHAAADQAGARPVVRQPATRPLRRRRAAVEDDLPDHGDPASTTESASTASTARRSSRGSTT